MDRSFGTVLLEGLTLALLLAPAMGAAPAKYACGIVSVNGKTYQSAEWQANLLGPGGKKAGFVKMCFAPKARNDVDLPSIQYSLQLAAVPGYRAVVMAVLDGGRQYVSRLFDASRGLPPASPNVKALSLWGTFSSSDLQVQSDFGMIMLAACFYGAGGESPVALSLVVDDPAVPGSDLLLTGAAFKMLRGTCWTD